MDTNALIERARSLEAGAELDAMFFETCWGWKRKFRAEAPWNNYQDANFWRAPREKDFEDTWLRCPPVSTDASACEAWAMRWARENKWNWYVGDSHATLHHKVLEPDDYGSWNGTVRVDERGTDWKHAFVRACIVAALTLNQRKETT